MDKGQAEEWTFDSDRQGELPRRTTAVGGTWITNSNDLGPSRANILCQASASTAAILTLGDSVYRDSRVSARIHFPSFDLNQAGGLVFHLQDQGNYYAAILEPRTGSVGLYKYAGGNRIQLAKSGAPIPVDQWHDLTVETSSDTPAGFLIRVFLEGKQVIRTSDETFKAGRMGLWSAGDRPTCFDDVQATAL